MHDPLACSDVQERLPLFVGDDLEPDVQEAVGRHLDGCGPCRERERGARAARSVFQEALFELAHRERSPGLWPGIRARLSAPEASPTGAPAERAALRWARIGGPLTAAAAVVLFFLVVDPLGLRPGPAGDAREGARPAPLALPASPAPGSPWIAEPAVDAVAVTPVARSGGLSPVLADEESLAASADELVIPDAARGRPAATRGGGTTLTGYR